MLSGKLIKRVAIASVAVTAVSVVSVTSHAMPFAAVGADRMVGESHIVEASTRKHRPVAKQRRVRANNNAALGAAVAIGVLGIAAAAAAAQPRRGEYIVDNRYYPVDAWGRPIYDARPVQQYEPGYYYYEQPGYRTYQEPAWGGYQPAPYGYRYQRQPAYVQPPQERRWRNQGDMYVTQQRPVRVQPQWQGDRGQRVYVDPRYGRRFESRPAGNENGGSGSN